MYVLSFVHQLPEPSIFIQPSTFQDGVACLVGIDEIVVYLSHTLLTQAYITTVNHLQTSS